MATTAYLDVIDVADDRSHPSKQPTIVVAERAVA